MPRILTAQLLLLALLAVAALVLFGIPLLWTLITLATHLEFLRLRLIDWPLLAVTVLYNLLAAIGATAFGLPVGWVMGRSRKPIARLLRMVVPVILFLPTIALTYGWKESIGHLGFRPVPAGPADIARCIFSLIAWLWPIPALAVAMTLKRADPGIAQQALLDGAMISQTLRQLRGVLLLCVAVTFLIASQEFSVFEPTGIRVVATEIRVVFESIGGTALLNQVRPDQRARAAAAVATAIPLLLVTLTLFAAALSLAWHDTQDRQTLPGKSPPTGILEPSRLTTGVATLLVVTAIAVPVAGLVLSSRHTISPAVIARTFWPEVTGSLLVASAAGIAASVIALLCSTAYLRTWARLALLGGAVLTFLLGGQIIAIALIRTYNRDLPIDLYDSMAMPVLAYLARFGWISVVAGLVAWTRPWRQIRELAAVDGASLSQTFWHVLCPMAAPVWIAAGGLVVAQSVTEVPATVLLSPQKPPMLVPMLIAWVHIMAYEPMVQASLLMLTLVALISMTALLIGGRSQPSSQ